MLPIKKRRIEKRSSNSEAQIEAEDTSGIDSLLFASQLRSSCEVVKAMGDDKSPPLITICGSRNSTCEQSEDTDAATNISINSIGDDSSIIDIYQKMMTNRLASMNNAKLASAQSRSMLSNFKNTSNHKRANIDSVQYDYNGLHEQQLRTSVEEERIYYTIMLNHVLQNQKIIKQRMLMYLANYRGISK